MNNDLKRFLLKSIVFLVLLFGADQIVGLGFDSIREKALENNPMAETNKPSYLVEKVDADVIIIGASDANHHYDSKMIADSLGMTVFNGGIDGCGFMTPCCLINLILDRYTPKMIIWEIWESGICGDEFDSMTKLYPWMGSSSFEPYYENLKFQDKAFTISKSYRYNSRLIDCVKPFFVAKDSSLGYRPLPSEGYRYPEKLNKPEAYTINPIKEEILINTIDRIQQCGVALIITSAPMYRSDDFNQNEGLKRMREIAFNKGMPFFDYLNIEPFCKSPELFKDVTHLNRNGSVILTKELINDINTFVVE